MAAATEVLERAIGEVESRGAVDADDALMMETSSSHERGRSRPGRGRAAARAWSTPAKRRAAC